jgi:hypothetical protein
MDRQQFAKLIAVACAAYVQELPEETVEIYWRSLESTPYEVASHRLQKHIEREKFFPRISDLRKPEAEGVRFLGVPIDPSKMLPGPKPNTAIADRVLAKIRQTLKGVPPANSELPRPNLERAPSRAQGACTCDLESEELCDYCKLWSATYG